MNPLTPEQLLMQILAAVLLINSQGKWHAFFNLAGHAGRVDVKIAPAGYDWTGDPTGKWPGTTNHAQLTATERDPDPQPGLLDLLDWTKSHLATEAAA